MPTTAEPQSHLQFRTAAIQAPWWDGLLCGCVSVLAVLCSYPVAEMGFIDDWSYVKTAFEYARTGHFVYNGWATAMLGWQIPWGALFAKYFGYTFTAVRASMLPVDAATVWLLYTVLVHFGIRRGNARFGALMLGLCPVFVPLAASYMSDVGGFFVILLCLYLCLRAAEARTPRSAILWLFAASATNVVGGTVRQIAWLGALVLVPSAAWLLRRVPRVLGAGIAIWAASVVGIFACLHWWNRQPYSVPEHLNQGRVELHMLGHMGTQMLRGVLCLAFLLLPVMCAWTGKVRKLSRVTWLAMAAFAAAVIVASVLNPKLPRFAGAPWLEGMLPSEGFWADWELTGPRPVTFPAWAIVGISIVVVLVLWTFLAELPTEIRRSETSASPSSWVRIATLIGPFCAAYICLLIPRAIYNRMFDRYFLGLLPFALIALLKLAEQSDIRRLPPVSYALLAAYGIFSVCATHDLYSLNRARMAAVNEVRAAGVPAARIAAGMEYDGWTEISLNGYVNFPDITVPPGAYQPERIYTKLPQACEMSFSGYYTAIRPQYVVAFAGSRCGRPARFTPVEYRAWLPPFRRTLEVVEP